MSPGLAVHEIADPVPDTAPTSTGDLAGDLQPKPLTAATEARRQPMPGLTGIRTCLALTILLFHFTPSGLRWEAHPWVSLYPIVDIGYVFVSFFFLISGFILSYNYAFRDKPVNPVDFWMARMSRLYPIYLLTMLVSIPFLLNEWHVRSHHQFWEGAIATPLLMQGWFPDLATFWMTVTWTLSCEVMLYLAFPWLVRLKWPRSLPTLLLMFFGFWAVGLVPHSIYIVRNPDHLAGMADRYSGGYWLNTLKYTPLPYVCTFFAGLTLGHIHEQWKNHARWPLSSRSRTIVGIVGFGAAYVIVYHLVTRMPYILVHGGLLTPVFALIILSLSGPGLWQRIFGIPPLLVIGTSTYALYLLHFNGMLLLQQHHVMEALHLKRFDPWISYVLVVCVAVAARKWVEHPAQVWIKDWWKAKRAAQKERAAAESA
ncbi:Peptidoglycan/LPS O-acetylase OafA/YrhL, contains acyltransferase and SGNH-hydrolase domains [Bryocella elongata]|uniref:Peptidoglycan/LPS O-acetylase OafA/YrhL, contains acyltransferase and SGNH-hydrolase domains n=1 Tax=Bryocella elongata TaxID=863522 RepID=A0A1H6A241_9BACT|nr:acyltransferase [Bryocella elongata]SEG42833.1 Peptidoglycan/LPS O-acetylase OafA/YrhL, contains acyltransferase and SGNH-hydrolase domains [Bryocella elongata]